MMGLILLQEERHKIPLSWPSEDTTGQPSANQELNLLAP